MGKKWLYVGKKWTYDIKEFIIIALHFVAIFSLLSMICAVNPELPAGETIGQWVWFGKAVWISMGCIVLSCLIQIWSGEGWKTVLRFQYFSKSVAWSIMLLGAIEAVWGLRQLYGTVTSGHAGYALTGSFYNPGPYGGYLAMALPICLSCYLHASKWWTKHIFRQAEKVIAGVSGILILCVLPATMSRTAWIAAAMGCAYVACMYYERRRWKCLWRRYKKRFLAWGTEGVLVLALAGAGLFCMKSDSALGRLFLWKISCKAVAENPWGDTCGFAHAYGEAQEKYFAEGNYAAWEERVAGSPEHAFNEYLEFMIEVGIAFFILLFGFILGCLLMGRSWVPRGVCGAILSLLLFSFSSYPMHIPGFMLAGVCLMFASWMGAALGKGFIMGSWLVVVVWLGGQWQKEEDACRDWAKARMLYRMGSYNAALKTYVKLLPLMNERGTFLFEYGHILHKLGEYEWSNLLLSKAERYSNDPMILNVQGKNYQAMKMYGIAKNYYEKAINRLPGRIYPYYLLAKYYVDLRKGVREAIINETEPLLIELYEEMETEKNVEITCRQEFERLKQIVMTKEPKVYSTAIREMRDELEKIDKEWDDIKVEVPQSEE